VLLFCDLHLEGDICLQSEIVHHLDLQQPHCVFEAVCANETDIKTRQRQGKTKQDKTRQDTTRQDKARQGKKRRQDKTKTRQDKTRQDKTKPLAEYTSSNFVIFVGLVRRMVFRCPCLSMDWYVSESLMLYVHRACLSSWKVSERV
jgi:hypothetical protein